jgi:8-oxo-dGTP pyrophosphatase MutT (NUDIX family)
VSAGEPTRRRVGRVIVLDPVGAVLLFEGRDVTRPDRGTWWFTPGGGADPGESTAEAARRELHEETGLELAVLGPVAHERRTAFEFEGEQIEQHETFFVARVERFTPVADGWTALERRSVLGHRWWTHHELATTDAVVYPGELSELVAGLVDPD